MAVNYSILHCRRLTDGAILAGTSLEQVLINNVFGTCVEKLKRCGDQIRFPDGGGGHLFAPTKSQTAAFHRLLPLHSRFQDAVAFWILDYDLIKERPKM